MDVCDHKYVVVDRGDTICTGCGLVVESFAFDTNAEYNADLSPIAPPSVPNLTKRFSRMESCVKRIGHALRLAEHVMSAAQTLTHRLMERSITVRENSLFSFAAAIVYHACKMENADRSESEFVATGMVDSRSMARANKRVRRELSNFIVHRGIDPSHLVQRFINILSRDFDKKTLVSIRSRTNAIIRSLSDRGGILDGKNPECACGACVTFAAHQVLDIPEETFTKLLCERCNLSQGTILNTLRHIQDHAKKNIAVLH